MRKTTKKPSIKPAGPFIPYAAPAAIRNLRADAAILANVVVSKVKADAISDQEREDVWEEGYQEGFAEAIAAMSRALLNDWGYLVPRKTRIAEIYCRVQRYRNELTTPCQAQLEAEREFTKQTGIPLGREHRYANM